MVTLDRLRICEVAYLVASHLVLFFLSGIMQVNQGRLKTLTLLSLLGVFKKKSMFIVGEKHSQCSQLIAGRKEIFILQNVVLTFHLSEGRFLVMWLHIADKDKYLLYNI